MSTLYNRATPSQKHLFRIVCGAVADVLNKHEIGSVSAERLGRSVAKRATGTISAHWPMLLSGGRGSPRAHPTEGVPTQGAKRRQASDRVAGVRSSGKGEAQIRKRTLQRLHNALGAAAKDAKKNGQTERFEGLREALRLIGAELKQES